MKQKKQRGFTLIELLVVISIIGFLASIVLVNLNGARKKARNVKRVGDIKQVVTALNLGIDSGSTLPITGAWNCISTTCYGGYSSLTSNASVDAFLAPNLPSKPSDPTESSRGYGGYIFNGNWSAGTAPYDGSTLQAGAYIDLVLEPPYTTGACGGGKVWQVTANYIDCVWVINQIIVEKVRPKIGVGVYIMHGKGNLFKLHPEVIEKLRTFKSYES